MIKPGDIIRGMQFPETVEIKRFEKVSENFYTIEALGRQSQHFYEMMVDKDDISTFEILSCNDESQTQLSAEDLQHFLQYNAFRIENKYSQSRALGGKKLIPLPHQIEAVYGKMLQMPKIRLLLADDPGAGKTIMAGMLIKELLARQAVSRILILVPPLVLVQWQNELFEKFGLDFFIINRQALRSRRHNPFLENDFCLASMFWGIRDDVKALISEAEYDLIIVDEAHKMAAYTYGKIKKKISRTKLYQLGESLLRKTDNCLLLTATPHKGDVENFRHFMSLIDYDIFSKATAGETLKDKSNPFIIRRIKENLKNFDGTPIFPKRSTKTITYNLTDSEKELYEDVTEYVRLYFNKAINNGNNSTAFAMMLLQRRLSSSIEAIYLSLKRRREKLNQLLSKTLEEREKYFNFMKNNDLEQFDEEDYETQENIENEVEGAVGSIDIDELKTEIYALEQLIKKTEILKLSSIEKKYQELEKTLFGIDGLLNRGEKILIFTESVDTLLYLEKKLFEHVEKITKISGKYSIDERRRQVNLFKNDCQVMLATDAGGESINLQFCNQMINYDIPWNPNKLEQRMGRIHRIGQRNEVFVFNMVARNTREGDVMMRLLNKMEQMREDLGTDMVYDFIGDIMEDKNYDLPTMMQNAVLNRENLDEIIAGMEKLMSEEHKRLLELYKKERINEETIDLSEMRRSHYGLYIKHIPGRCYADFCKNIFIKKRIRLNETKEGKVLRIDRLPKFIRDFARKNNISIKEKREKQLDKVINFLNKTFQSQYNDTLEKLTLYQQDNEDNKNSVLINQMNATLLDIEIRKEERISEVQRQKNIIMKPPKKIAQLELIPNGAANRIFPSDYKDIIERHEHQNGRSKFKMFNTYALVDFYSERYNGEPRFIILTKNKEVLYSTEYLNDLNEIIDNTYIYYVDDEKNVTEYSVKDKWMIFLRV
jgi:superfamily II DNA or RNA helicase